MSKRDSHFLGIDWWSHDQVVFTLLIIFSAVGLLISEGGYRFLGWWRAAP